ncbi:hypothetical protein ACVIGB_008726 [Bradyrhizobium sp. USDA 4341]
MRLGNFDAGFIRRGDQHSAADDLGGAPARLAFLSRQEQLQRARYRSGSSGMAEFRSINASDGSFPTLPKS